MKTHYKFVSAVVLVLFLATGLRLAYADKLFGITTRDFIKARQARQLPKLQADRNKNLNPKSANQMKKLTNPYKQSASMDKAVLISPTKDMKGRLQFKGPNGINAAKTKINSAKSIKPSFGRRMLNKINFNLFGRVKKTTQRLESKTINMR